MKSCHACGEEWTDKRSPGFREECMKCGDPLHCCANCRFYDAQAYEWCREPQARAEKPRDPQQSNTCDYFVFGETGDHSALSEREQKAKEGLAALFGETESGQDSEREDDKPDWMKMG